MPRMHRSRARNAGFRQSGSRNTLIFRQFLWGDADIVAIALAPPRKLEIAQGKDAGAKPRKLALLSVSATPHTFSAAFPRDRNPKPLAIRNIRAGFMPGRAPRRQLDGGLGVALHTFALTCPCRSLLPTRSCNAALISAGRIREWNCPGARLRVLREARGSHPSEMGACVYRKLDSAILVMQSAEDRL